MGQLNPRSLLKYILLSSLSSSVFQNVQSAPNFDAANTDTNIDFETNLPDQISYLNSDDESIVPATKWGQETEADRRNSYSTMYIDEKMRKGYNGFNTLAAPDNPSDTTNLSQYEQNLQFNPTTSWGNQKNERVITENYDDYENGVQNDDMEDVPKYANYEQEGEDVEDTNDDPNESIMDTEYGEWKDGTGFPIRRKKRPLIKTYLTNMMNGINVACSNMLLMRRLGRGRFCTNNY